MPFAIDQRDDADPSFALISINRAAAIPAFHRHIHHFLR